MRTGFIQTLVRGKIGSVHRQSSMEKPLVVIGLESFSADWFCGVITRYAQRLQNSRTIDQNNGLGPIIRLNPLKRGTTRSRRDLRPLISEPAGPGIIVTHVDIRSWAELFGEHPERFNFVYLRPGLLVLKHMLPGIAGNPDALTGFRWKLALHLDRLLSAHATVSVEDLYYNPGKVAGYLNNRFRLKLDYIDFSCDGLKERYRAATSALLRLADDDDFALRAGISGFAVDQTYSTASGELGALALEEGWSWSEKAFTWNHGDRASLVFPVVPGSKFSRLRLRGILAPGPCTTRIFVAGKLSSTFRRSAADPRHVTIDVPLPRSPYDDRSMIRLDFEFGCLFCPRDAGWSNLDSRQLSLALKSFAIQTLDQFRVAATAPRQVARRSPHAILKARGNGGTTSVLEVLENLAEAGLAGSLITMYRVPAYQRRSWLQSNLWKERMLAALDAGIKGGAWYGLVDEHLWSPTFEQHSLAEEAATRSSRWTERNILAFFGTPQELVAELSKNPYLVHLIVLWSTEAFEHVLGALLSTAENNGIDSPDIAIYTEDPSVLERNWRKHPPSYEKSIYRSIVFVDQILVYCSRTRF